MDAIEERERLLMSYLVDRLHERDYLTIIGPPEGSRHYGAVSFDVADVHPHDVASILDMQNVCIRAGHHCAQPLLTYLGWHSTCRASIAFYNDKLDIDRLVEGLDQVWGIFHGSR
jgi:cysteine desulfurase/selenocysteine lyase